MNINGREVGLNHPPLVIAEIGINHGGSLAVAKEMVDAAISAGCEIIKHQTHIIDDEMSSKAKETIPGNSEKSIYQIMSECALSEEDEFELAEYVKSKGAIFISTPFSRKAVDRLVKFDIPVFKIGSGECNNHPLLEYICSFGKPIILSTGMNSLADVEKSVNIIRSYNIPFALLHTTNLYPTPNELVRLGCITDLKNHFPDAIVGLSDHTLDNLACLGAVALGASILERHFTDSKDRIGPDIICSMDPKELSELISQSAILQKQRGGSKNELLKEEQVTRDFAFSTVVAIANINEGELFTEKNIWVKRPGTGEIKAEHFKNILGKVCKSTIDKDTHIRWNDVEGFSS